MDPSGLFRIRDFPYLKFGIRDFKAKSGRDSGLKVYAGDEMPKITVNNQILGLIALSLVINCCGELKSLRAQTFNEVSAYLSCVQFSGYMEMKVSQARVARSMVSANLH